MNRFVSNTNSHKKHLGYRLKYRGWAVAYMLIVICVFSSCASTDLDINPLADKSPVTNETTYRQIMLDYVDEAVAAHLQRNDEVLADFWSVSSPVLQRGMYCGTSLPRKMPTYWDTTLRKEFKKGKLLGADVNTLSIVEHPTIEYIYGQTLKISLTIGDNTGSGYMFMVWDFRNPDTPQILVRTWQPEYIDKEKGRKLDSDDIFVLPDFDL